MQNIRCQNVKGGVSVANVAGTVLIAALILACGNVQTGAAARPFRAQSQPPWSQCSSEVSMSDDLYSPPVVGCLDQTPELQQCVNAHASCIDPLVADTCYAATSICTEQYVECINSVVMEASTMRLTCPWALTTRVAIMGVVAGASYNGSVLQRSCFRIVCDAYVNSPQVCFNTTDPWFGPEACEAPSPQTRTKSVTHGAIHPSNRPRTRTITAHVPATTTAPPPTPTQNGTDAPPNSTTTAPVTLVPLPSGSTPVPVGIKYQFTASFIDGDASFTAKLAFLARALGVNPIDINVTSINANGTFTFEINGPEATSATQRLLGIIGDPAALAAVGLSDLLAAPISVSPPSTPAPPTSDDKSDTYLIVIIVVCSVVGVLLLAGGAVFGFKKYQQSKLVSFNDYVGMVEKPLNPGGISRIVSGPQLMQSRSGRVVPPAQNSPTNATPRPMAADTVQRRMSAYSPPSQAIVNVSALPAPQWSEKAGDVDDNAFGPMQDSFADPFDLGSNGSMRSPHANPLPLNTDNTRTGRTPHQRPKQPSPLGPRASQRKLWEDDPDL